MTNDAEERLIEVLKNVDAHGDVAPPYVHDPTPFRASKSLTLIGRPSVAWGTLHSIA